MAFSIEIDEKLEIARERGGSTKRIKWQAMVSELQQQGGNPTNYLPGQRSLVAIIDSGYNSHADVAPDRLYATYNVMDNTQNVSDRTGHGTAMAAIVAGSSEVGNDRGMLPGAALIVVKVDRFLLKDYVLTPSVPVEFIENALEWLVENQSSIEARSQRRLGVVNLSLAGGIAYTQPPKNWQLTKSGRLIRRLRDRGVLTVSGAGNTYHLHSREGMHWPAILPDCVSVGATYDENTMVGKTLEAPDSLTYYTNRIHSGPHQTTLFAPGSVIMTRSSGSDNVVRPNEGTSSATPIGAGAIVMIQELHYAKTGGWPSADQVVASLTATATRLKSNDGHVYPFLNLAAAAGVPETLPLAS